MKTFEMSGQQLARTSLMVDHANKKIGVTGKPDANKLGRDSFLKLLVTELRHQDPTKPMEDREFIAQMAQFSSLEQITNLNNEIRSLRKNYESSEAYSLLGRRIEAFNPETKRAVSGHVTSIENNRDGLEIMVGNDKVRIENIRTVYADRENPAGAARTINVKK